MDEKWEFEDTLRRVFTHVGDNVTHHVTITGVFDEDMRTLIGLDMHCQCGWWDRDVKG